ncbi:hypothetical protein K438DRAFT_1985102 [Mycena galopus ATCC 62051]|nr:hypothetical protein K438DRAFT_1985102 [Mycena galopus ATCC 62051]
MSYATPSYSYAPPAGPPPPTSTSAQIQYYPPPAGSPPQISTPPSGVHLSRDADYLIESFLPPSASPPSYGISKLPLPYCVPQLTPAFDAPFCRAYNPTLECVDISQEQLLAFIDGLNLAMTASPPLRVVNIVGMAIGFVPYHWAMIAGTAIQIGAQTGMHVLSKTLTDRYLRSANLRLFKPRGLSVRICTTAAMQHLVMGTPITAGPSKLTRFGRGVGSVAMKLPIPLASMIVHAVATKPPPVPAMNPGQVRSAKLLAAQRRAAALQGYALPLDFDMPKAAKAQGVMDTMSSWGVKFDSWRNGRTQQKAEELRLQLERERGGSTQYQYSGGGGLLGGGSNQISLRGGLGGLLRGDDGDRRSRRRDKRSGDRGGGAAATLGGGLMGLVGQTRIGGRVLGHLGGGSGALDRRRGPIELQVANADLIEHWQSSKVLWVVIMNSEMDDEIELIEMAESENDVERVDEPTWQAEMAMEKEDLKFDAEVQRVAQEEASYGQKSPSY